MTQNTPSISPSPNKSDVKRKDGVYTIDMTAEELEAYFRQKRKSQKTSAATECSKSLFGIDNEK